MELQIHIFTNTILKKGASTMSEKAFKGHLRGNLALKQKAIEEFVKASRSGRMVAFVGSYTSLEFGYLKWEEFLQKVTETGSAHVAEWAQAAKKRFATIDQNTIIDYELLLEAGFVSSMAAEEIGKMFTLDKHARPPIAIRPVNRPKFGKTSTITEICEGLGIDRIITLNYDLEFEHHLMTDPSTSNPNGLKAAYTELKKLKESAANSEFSQRMRKVTSDGKRVISDCFQRERADQLFSFAIHAPDTNAHIMHLHGRADAPNTMVVNYSDYERQYRKSGITKLPFQHALKLLFAGNPIVFIGIGMSEEELLGTLRQFVSDDRPNYLAPDFIIWSPKDGNGHRTNRTVNGVSPEDELKRLRWYRQFGVFTLFDTELEGFDPAEDNDAEGSLRRSVTLLAENARKELNSRTWKPDEFRQMVAFINAGIDEGGANVWPVANRVPTFDPNWLYNSNYAAALSPLSAAQIPDKDYLHWLIDYGSPIKAFLDSPGSGHGYLAQIIKSSLEDMRQAGEDIIYCQLNAGFAWEIDSTFALVSGLYDRVTAFEEKMSRTKSFQKFVQDLMARAKDGEGPKRRIVIAINGADRFFDNSGYPLSSELDILIRLVPRLNKHYQYLRNEAARQQHNNAASSPNQISKADWQREEFPLPVTLIVFGTNRVGRYLDGLGLAKGRIDQRQAADYDILGSMAEPFGSSEPVGRTLVERIRLAQTSDTSGASFPLEPDIAPDTFKSVYLRLTEAALRGARKAKHPKSPELKLGIAAETALDRCRHGDTGRQRRAFFEIFLSPAVLQQVFDDTPIASSTLRLPREKAALALAIMRKMALVGQPVEAATLAEINPIKGTTHNVKANDILTFLEELQLLNLVSEIAPFPGVITTPNNRRFALHRALLQEIRERGSVPLSDARTYTSFNIPLYVAQPIDDHEPDDEVYEELGQLLDELIGFEDDPTDDDTWASVERGNRLRAAFASTRSYYTASSMLMHEPDPKGDDQASRLSEYAQRLERLIKASERAADARKNLITAGTLDVTQNPSPVFPDDLVWIHDHRGTTLLAQGDLYEARHALKSAEQFNRKFVEFESHDQNFRRLQINQIHVDIERGKIDHAENRLRLLEQSINHQAEQLPWAAKNSKRPEKEHFVNAVSEILEKFGAEPRRRARIVNTDFPADLILATGVMTGYRAWCEYIRGRLRTSDRYFRQAILILRNIGEQRAYAIFLRLHVALLEALGDHKAATDSINLCIAAADSTRQLDISHMAWTTKSGLDLRYNPNVNRAEIMKQLMATLRYSSQTDMYRVRMEALGTLARLRFEAGDYDGALERASDAMAIAIRFGFALRKISLRILIGTCLIRRGDPISGNAILDEAVRIADLLGYQRAIELAHRARTDLASMFI
jgi:tetratricopeptide (TPR) repeat protein